MTDTPNDWTDNDLEQLSRIAPSAGAPSDRAGKIREDLLAEVRRILNRPRRAGEDSAALELTQYVHGLLDAECKAAAAAALEQAVESIERRASMWTGGEGTPAWDIRGELNNEAATIRALSPSPNYIALREAEARIDEYRANEAAYSASLYVHGPRDVRTNFEKWRMWKEQHVAALTEARDKLAKK